MKDLGVYGRDNIRMAVRGVYVLESSALARSRWLAVYTTVMKVKDLHKTMEIAWLVVELSASQKGRYFKVTWVPLGVLI